jgi:hypothetical protein
VFQVQESIIQGFLHNALEHLQSLLTHQRIQVDYVPDNTTSLSARELCDIQVLLHLSYI